MAATIRQANMLSQWPISSSLKAAKGEKGFPDLGCSSLAPHCLQTLIEFALLKPHLSQVNMTVACYNGSIGKDESDEASGGKESEQATASPHRRGGKANPMQCDLTPVR